MLGSVEAWFVVEDMTMKTVAIASQKGGTGKTTTAVHLATAATIAGYHAVVIDLDPQGSAATWGDDRGESAPEVVSGQASRLDVLLEGAAKEGFDLVVIDTGPAADAAARRCAEKADLILIPCRPAAFDLKAIRTTLDLVDSTRTPAFVVLNAAPIRSRAVDEARDVVAGLGAKVAPVVICQRAAYVHSVISGQTAQEFEPGGKAAEEIGQLWNWVKDQLRLPPLQKAA
jgi:chromosome partitioning protein